MPCDGKKLADMFLSEPAEEGVTEEMISAGVAVFESFSEAYYPDLLVREIYSAMNARRFVPRSRD